MFYTWSQGGLANHFSAFFFWNLPKDSLETKLYAFPDFLEMVQPAPGIFKLFSYFFLNLKFVKNLQWDFLLDWIKSLCPAYFGILTVFGLPSFLPSLCPLVTIFAYFICHFKCPPLVFILHESYKCIMRARWGHLNAKRNMQMWQQGTKRTKKGKKEGKKRA